MSMGTNYFYHPVTISVGSTFFLHLACVVFLFVSITGLHFLSPDIGELGFLLGAQDLAATTQNSFLRQSMFVGALLALTLIYIHRKGIASLTTLIPLHIYLLLGWAAFTLLWSPVPQLGGRRLFIVAIIFASSFMMARILGAARTVGFAFAFLLVFVFLSVIAGFIIPKIAIHQFSEQAEDVIGAWRGLFGHKGFAGFFAAVCFIEVIFSRRAYIYKGAGLAACGFLILMSAAKSDIILLPVSLFLYTIFVLVPRRLGASGFVPVVFTAIALLFGSIVGLLPFLDEIELIFSNPNSLNGRVGLWLVIFQFLQNNFWTGGGFDSVWAVGTASPLLAYSSGWQLRAGNAHNGYLDMMVQIGFPGLVLSLFSLFIWPVLKLRKQSVLGIHTRDMVLCVLIFTGLYNLTSASIMNMTGPSVLLILCCAVASCLSTDNGVREVAGHRRSRTIVRQRASRIHLANPSSTSADPASA
jgi:O-antigen ligase